MLLHIPQSFTPQLMMLMMELGHGEELLLCDANYPWKTTTECRDRLFVPLGSIEGLLRDILYFFPLDETVPAAVTMMDSARGSGAYQACLRLAARDGENAAIETLDRFEFYRRARGAAGVVVTADTVKGGNVLLKKGVVRG